jgi:hypothetical protein
MGADGERLSALPWRYNVLVGISSTTAPTETDEQRRRVSIGYTCFCGERVAVYGIRGNGENVIPTSKTVSCSNGHVATFSAQHFALLDDWSEDGCS